MAAKQDDDPEPEGGKEPPADKGKEPPKPEGEEGDQDNNEPEDQVMDDYQEDGENDKQRPEDIKQPDDKPENEDGDDDAKKAQEEEIDGDGDSGDEAQKEDPAMDEAGDAETTGDAEDENEDEDELGAADDEAELDREEPELTSQENLPDATNEDGEDPNDDENQEPQGEPDDAMEQDENQDDADEEDETGPNDPEDQEKPMGEPDEEEKENPEDPNKNSDDTVDVKDDTEKADGKEDGEKEKEKEETAKAPAQMASAVMAAEDNQANNAVMDDDQLDGQDVSQGQAGDEQASASSLNAEGNSQTNSAPEENTGNDQNYEHNQKANPYRSVGDALKAWQDRLKVYDTNETPKKEGKTDDGKQNDPQAAEAFSHIEKDSENYDAQVLDTATEEQQRKAQINPHDDGADQVDEDPENVVDQSAMEPQPDAMDDTEDAASQNEVTTDAVDSANAPVDADGLTAKKLEDASADAEVPRPRAATGEIQMLAPGLGMEGLEDDHDGAVEDEEVDEQTYDRLRTKLEEDLSMQSGENTMQTAQAIEELQRFEGLTSPLAQDLCEKLRLILEESKIAKLQGDFRTGKRLNMRKIIPYIASEFRKDKIWLRRTKPSKREYQIMLAIDDSHSMKQYRSQQLALEALFVIGKALNTLEAGELSVMSFGEQSRLLHPFGTPFTEQSGATILQEFQFDQKKSNIAALLQDATAVFEGAKNNSSAQNTQNKQLLFVISDSDQLHQEGTSFVERVIRQVNNAGIFLVFVIIDSPEKQHSILKQQKAVIKDGKVVIDDYMDRFSDKRYIVLQDINLLPMQVGDALRQWFEIVANTKND